MPWIIVVLNGFARIYVGAHNPLDVVGGAGLGLFIAGILNAVLMPTQPGEPASGTTVIPAP